MTLRVAINGFGRIGRLVCRAAIADPRLELVAINGTAAPSTLAHLLKYDSIHGTFKAAVEAGDNLIRVDGIDIRILSDRDPLNLPWGDLGIDLVIECTGKFNKRNDAAKHLRKGAKRVLLSAPGKDEDVTIVFGVNHEEYDPKRHFIISNASCTTNCLAPVAKILNREFGIEQGLMTTIHSYTNDQRNLDGTHKDLRRARASGLSIIPTTTGAAAAVGKVLPELEGKLNGFALRVPTPNVSVVDLVCDFTKPVTSEAINAVLKAAADTELKGILGYTEEPLVSCDFNGDDRSSIVDALSTMTIGERMGKVVAWYDNELGYSCRILDIAHYIGNLPMDAEVAL